MDNKLQNIAIIFLLCVVVVLLGLNLLKNSSSPGPMSGDRSGEVKSLDPSVKPEDDPYIINQVKNTIVKRSDTIQKCYNAYLEGKPEKVEGRVKMDWRIESDGDVSGAEMVTAEFGDDDFWNCMKAAIGKWNFPDPPGGQQKYVAHKFFFKKTKNLKKKSRGGFKSTFLPHGYF